MDTKDNENEASCGCVGTGPCDCTCHGDCHCHKPDTIVNNNGDAQVVCKLCNKTIGVDCKCFSNSESLAMKEFLDGVNKGLLDGHPAVGFLEDVDPVEAAKLDPVLTTHDAIVCNADISNMPKGTAEKLIKSLLNPSPTQIGVNPKFDNAFLASATAAKIQADSEKGPTWTGLNPLGLFSSNVSPDEPQVVVSQKKVEDTEVMTDKEMHEAFENVAKQVVVSPKICTFPDCGKKVIAKGLCVSHYRQGLRNKPLKALRPFRNLVRLPMVIRVEQKTLDALKKRVSDGKASSMYDSTRQALEVGVMLLEVLDQEKKTKK